MVSLSTVLWKVHSKDHAVAAFASGRTRRTTITQPRTPLSGTQLGVTSEVNFSELFWNAPPTPRLSIVSPREGAIGKYQLLVRWVRPLLHFVVLAWLQNVVPCDPRVRRSSYCEATGGQVTVTPVDRTPRVSVVVPTFNEAKNLPYVFNLMPNVHEVIVVDGRSTDATIEVARRLRPDARIVQQSRCGKGNALACGFAASSGEIIVMLDADGSADPREIPRFVRALVEGADFAKGTRFGTGGGSGDITRLRRYGNKALNGLVNVVFGTTYSDLCYGFNAFWRHCLPVFRLDVGEPTGGMAWGDGFEIETLINVRAAQARLRVVEVPSYEAVRIHGDSNLNAVTDGLRVLRTIAMERWQRSQAVAHNSMIDLAGVSNQATGEPSFSTRSNDVQFLSGGSRTQHLAPAFGHLPDSDDEPVSSRVTSK